MIGGVVELVEALCKHEGIEFSAANEKNARYWAAEEIKQQIEDGLRAKVIAPDDIGKREVESRKILASLLKNSLDNLADEVFAKIQESV